MFNSTSANLKPARKQKYNSKQYKIKKQKEYKQTTKNQYTEIGTVTELNGEGEKSIKLEKSNLLNTVIGLLKIPAPLNWRLAAKTHLAVGEFYLQQKTKRRS